MKKQGLAWALRKFWPLYLMMVPGLVYFLVYRYLPMAGAVIAFQDFNIMKGLFGSRWADPWYANFLSFFDSPYFGQLLGNTLIISFGKMLFTIIPSILLAILLTECRSRMFKSVVQTVSYMPHFLSWVVVYAVFYAMLSQNGGLIAGFLADVTGQSVEYLSEPTTFRWLLFFSDMWQSTGWGAIIFLAAMAGINPELYEAAKIDGAGRLRRIWSITLPSISTVIVFVLVTRLGRVMDAGFEHVFIFYNQRVYEVADIIDTWVFRVGLQDMDFGMATAVGLFKSAIGFLLVMGTNAFARKQGRGLW